MSLRSVLRHTAVPFSRVEFGELVEGQPQDDVLPGRAFPCVIFLGETAEQNRRGREVRQTQMLYTGFYDDGSVVPLDRADHLLVTAPELNEALGRPAGAPLRFQVQGDPQPAGKPGRRIKVMLVNLKQVKD